MPPLHSRSLLFYFAQHIFIPLSLITFGLLFVGFFVYQQTTLTLLLDRDGELATLVAHNIEHEINEYVAALEDFAHHPELMTNDASTRLTVMQEFLIERQVFYTGLVMTGPNADLVAVVPETFGSLAQTAIQSGLALNRLQPTQKLVSNLILDEHGQEYIVVGVPLPFRNQVHSGVLLGIVRLSQTELLDLITEVSIGERGYAYLVDRQGRVLYHPEAEQMGADVSQHSFVQNALAGKTGGVLWNAPQGERLIVDFAPVPNVGWGILTQEPWEAAVAPAQIYVGLLTVTGLLLIALAVWLFWRAVRRVTMPITHLSKQITNLTTHQAATAMGVSGIAEVDHLGQAFNHMMAQLEAYRTSLRRYIDALTQAQEEERRRVARDLHDETIQRLSSLARRLELYHDANHNPVYQAQLMDIRAQITDVFEGVRQISHDLRPPLLDDLGLLPALESLTKTMRHESDGIRQTTIEVIGKPAPLRPEQELAIYRIAQEALTNARKHAHAEHLHLCLEFNSHIVQLSISDNGRGFVPPTSFTEFIDKGHLGLVGIQERVWALGGSLKMSSSLGRGTELTVILPLANGHKST